MCCTGAGEDYGIDHHENWLRFPYDSTVWRSHHLQPHPYNITVRAAVTRPGAACDTRSEASACSTWGRSGLRASASKRPSRCDRCCQLSGACLSVERGVFCCNRGWQDDPDFRQAQIFLKNILRVGRLPRPLPHRPCATSVLCVVRSSSDLAEISLRVSILAIPSSRPSLLCYRFAVRGWRGAAEPTHRPLMMRRARHLLATAPQ
jgi:hypothetical protein